MPRDGESPVGPQPVGSQSPNSPRHRAGSSTIGARHSASRKPPPPAPHPRSSSRYRPKPQSRATGAIVAATAALSLLLLLIAGVAFLGNRPTTTTSAAITPSLPESTTNTTTSAPPPGTLIKRQDSPEVSVIAGQARIPYTAWQDLVAGYGPEPEIETVPDTLYDSLPTTPRPGTLIKAAAGPDIAAVVGSARRVYPSWDSLVADYGQDPPFVTVPTPYYDALPAAR